MQEGRAMSDEDQLVEDVQQTYARFEQALHRAKPFPQKAFAQFFQAAWRYAESVKDKEIIHRKVASVVSGLRETLEALRVPGDAIASVDRLECLLFSGYDPHFEGDEPPGL
jgi:hypothetical protein